MKKQIPNIITCCNLVCGCIATAAGFNHKFATALLFILLGALFDFFDGFTARKLKVSGPIGVELDSLADVVTFGVAPSSMLFVLFKEVHCFLFMYNDFWFFVMPITAFLIPAFSAYRLAKFNLDERQHTSFIGMPTPANAIFWASLIVGFENYLKSPMFNSLFLFLFIVMFAWLLVSEIPMFSLKFQNYSWQDNKVKYSFLISTVIIIALFLSEGIPAGHAWVYLAKGLASSIGLYLIICLVQFKCRF